MTYEKGGKEMRKFFSTILAIMMTSCLFTGCSGDTATTTGDNSAKGDIAILYTNDVHTYIDGPLSYDVIAALKEEMQKQYDEVLLVDAGDHIQGTAYGSMDKGATIIEMMNAAG